MRRFTPILLALVVACCTPRAPSPPQPIPVPQAAPTPVDLGLKDWFMPTLFETLETLGAKEPLPMPLRIVVCPLKDKWGDSRFDENTCEFEIRLSPTPADPDFLRQIVIHEWAHCLTQCKCEDPHCCHWGVNFARGYRAIYNEATAPPSVDDPNCGDEDEPEED